MHPIVLSSYRIQKISSTLTGAWFLVNDDLADRYMMEKTQAVPYKERIDNVSDLA
jgi:hypothetical protein